MHVLPLTLHVATPMGLVPALNGDPLTGFSAPVLALTA